jgi:hypothetical protein
MDYVEALSALTPDHPRPWVFMGGGISDCPDWQAEVVEALSDCPHGTLINPRRSKFPEKSDREESLKQIMWEFEKINSADIFTMWFCKETLGPICLLETGIALGKWQAFSNLSAGQTHPYAGFIVGGDHEYARRFDVEIQTALALKVHPGETTFHTTLEQHAEFIRDTVEGFVQTLKDREENSVPDPEPFRHTEMPEPSGVEESGDEEESDLQAEE